MQAGQPTLYLLDWWFIPGEILFCTVSIICSQCKLWTRDLLRICQERCHKVIWVWWGNEEMVVGWPSMLEEKVKFS